MVLCATEGGEGAIDILEPPLDAQPGDHITFEGHGREPEEQLAEVNLVGEDGKNLKDKNNKPIKQTAWDRVAPALKTNAEGVACWGEKPFMTAKGPITVPNVKGAQIS